MQVSTLVDGHQSNEAKLDYCKGRIAYSVTDTVIHENKLYVGHAVSPAELHATTGIWNLGTLMMFEGYQKIFTFKTLSPALVQYMYVCYM